MFPPYPSMTVFVGAHECTARINRNCTGKSDHEIFRISIGRGQCHDLCERCERTYRRRYRQAMDRFYEAAMAGEINGTWSGKGGVFIIG